MNAYEQQAIDALRAWHSVAASEYPANMKMSFDEFLAYAKLKGPDFLTLFGKSVAAAASLSGVGMQGVLQSMEALARQSQGRVSQYPDGYPRMTEFFDALVGRALQWDVRVVTAVAKDTAVEGLQNVATAGKWFLGGSLVYLAIAGLFGVYIFASSFKRVKT